MGIALGLAAALCWGLADYFAAIASRRTVRSGTSTAASRDAWLEVAVCRHRA